ncbi:MAG: hypothetical protein OXF11_16215 [Deltaproteobacteria bacterium]|nr:hypothetical protein [Deltaproteobacteria bacterium]
MRFARRVPGFRPAITHGLSFVRGIPASTVSTAGVSGTLRHPVLPSLSRSSPAVWSTSSHLSVRISFRRQPVSSSRRSAGIAGGNTVPSASASSSTRPNSRYSAGVRDRARRAAL